MGTRSLGPLLSFFRVDHPFGDKKTKRNFFSSRVGLFFFGGGGGATVRIGIRIIRNEKSREDYWKTKERKTSSSSYHHHHHHLSRHKRSQQRRQRQKTARRETTKKRRMRRRREEEIIMSVLVETSKGDLVIDVFASESPKASLNFLKLCALKYYNDCKFFSVQRDFVVQSGDPTNTGQGGASIYSMCGKEDGRESRRLFADEIVAEKDQKHALKHDQIGTVSCANFGREDTNQSQFLITTRDSVPDLDGKHTIFGRVVEGLDVLQRINEAYCDENGRPWQNIRIKHTIVLDDPFEDPKGMPEAPDESPKVDRSVPDDRLEDDFDAEAAQEMDEIELEKKTREQEARSRAVVLEMIGDLPDADAKPPEESLFVCKLNPVTSDEDLEIIFSRFGKVTSCDVIRDRRTGDSLCYAFINFETKEMCEAAYFKMDNALIDDRRIHVDFSQSMHGLWKNFRKFGKKGGTEDDMVNAANAKRGDGSGGANWQSKNRTLEVKGRGGGRDYQYQHYDDNNNNNRKSYDHLDRYNRSGRDDKEDDRERRRRKEKKRRDRSRSRSRDRKERRKEKDHHKRRDRSRSRDREDRKHSRRY